MRSKLLIGTAALLAGMAVASAQNMPQGGGQQGPAGAPEKSAPPSAQPGQRGGQAQPSQDKGKAQQGQAPAQRGQKDQTTGQGAQGQGEQGKAQRQPETKGQGESKGQTQGQTPQRDQSQQGQQNQGQRQPSQAQGQQGQSGGAANLTTEQRTRIRETVITSGPKVSSVNFSLSVGTVVPRTVTVVGVPAIIVEVYPQYRGLMYFVVGDQIIIVDQSHKIVAVISV
ncbi:MAG: DUF1236 domain-containing protein [Xanthobacteraceae bacterium]|jgi:Protein of unknown function (DUF1236)